MVDRHASAQKIPARRPFIRIAIGGIANIHNIGVPIIP